MDIPRHSAYQTVKQYLLSSGAGPEVIAALDNMSDTAAAGVGSITVRGSDILAPPLLRTSSAKVVEFRNAAGELTCFWVRLFENHPSHELWGFCSKADNDWTEMCIRYGYQQPKSANLHDALAGEG